MKKIFLTILLFSATYLIACAQFIGVGVRGGMNFANVSLNTSGSTPTPNADGKLGYQAAGIVEFGFNKLFSIAPEIIYSVQGFKESATTLTPEINYNLNYIQVPVLARLSLGFKVGRIFLNAGPQLGLRTSAKAIASGFPDTDISSRIKSTDFGIVFGGGAALNAGPGAIFTDIRYTLGLTNINATSSGVEAKNGVFTISLGYMFKFGL